jgi:GTPase SAR1 family protein
VEPPKRKRFKSGEMVALSLTLAQVDLITEDAFIGEHLLTILYAAKVYDNIVRVLCTLDDLDQLSKHVADVANKTTDKKHQQKLYTIFEEIRALEQSYGRVPLRIVASNPSVKRTELEI